MRTVAHSSYLSSVSPTRTSSPDAQAVLGDERVPADVRAVRRAEILDVARAVARHDARVPARDVRVAVEHDVVVGIAPERHVPSSRTSVPGG